MVVERFQRVPRVHELNMTRDFISSSYSFTSPNPCQEFVGEEHWSIKLSASGLSKEQLRKVYEGLVSAGIAIKQAEIP